MDELLWRLPKTAWVRWTVKEALFRVDRVPLRVRTRDGSTCGVARTTAVAGYRAIENVRNLNGVKYYLCNAPEEIEMAMVGADVR